MKKYYDTHSHILDNDLNDINYINEFIEKMEINNVFSNLVGVDLMTSIKFVDLAKNNKNHFRACIGIHPNDVYLYDKDKQIFNKLYDLIDKNKDIIVGIGEVGLDLYYTNKYFDLQKLFLNKFIELANHFNLPVIYHIRNAFDEIKEFIVKNRYNKNLIHCFSTNRKQAEFYLNNNCVLSIPGIVTFKKTDELTNAIKNIDLSKIVCETDTPFLTPVPFRGKKNHPIYVEYVYKKISEIKKMDLEITINKINSNAMNFFNIKF